MTIKRTYVVAVRRQDGDIDYLYRKGKCEHEVVLAVEAEFPDDYVGICQRLKRFKRDTQNYLARPIFRRNPFRGGQYVYRHKGKKKRGRKNYPVPNGGYTRQPIPVMEAKGLVAAARGTAKPLLSEHIAGKLSE